MLSARLFTRRATAVTTSSQLLSSLRFNSASAASEETEQKKEESRAKRRGSSKKKKPAKWEQHTEWSAAEFEGESGEGGAHQHQRTAGSGAEDDQPFYSDSYDDLIAAHRVLGTRPGDPLYRVKLSYMMRCRESHPEVDGDPATFYKIALAYERIIKDRGMEMRDGRIVFGESVPKLPAGHDPLADVSRQVLLRAAEEIPGVDRYERSEALDQMREARMSLAGTSEMLRNPSAPMVSEMKAIEHLELVEDILLAPQPLQGMAWHEQPFRMLTAEVRQREGDEAAKLLEDIVAPVRLKIGGAGEGEEAQQQQKQLPASEEKQKILSAESAVKEGKSSSALSPLTGGGEGGEVSIPGVPAKIQLMMDADEKKDLLQKSKYESRCLAPVTDDITPELLHNAAEIGKRAANEKGVLKFEQPEATCHVTDYLGPGTRVVAARQFEALGRAGNMSTYARYSDFPHPPKRLDQLPADLEESHQLRPEEEEAVARSIINKQLDEGKIAPETVMNYLSKSSSVAGMAAQTATVWMESTEERRFLFAEFSLFLALFFALVACGLATLAAWIRYHQVFGNEESSKKRQKQQYLNLDTMMPWWGNDAMYEQSVKRIFLEEYKKGRQAAEQMKHYQAGLEQETLTPEQKKQLELDVFTVSAEDVQRMRQKIKQQSHVKPDEPLEELEEA